MIELGGRLGFAPKPGECLVRVDLVSEHTFQSDDASGVSLPGVINHPHPAAPDFKRGARPSAIPWKR